MCHLVAVKLELDVTEVCVQRDGLRVREGSTGAEEGTEWEECFESS